MFLAERVFSKNKSLYAPVPLSKRLTFGKEKPGEDLKVRAAEVERSALNAVINLVEVSQLVDLPELFEHRVVKECLALFNYRNHTLLSSTWEWSGEWLHHQQKTDRSQIAHHTHGQTMSTS